MKKLNSIWTTPAEKLKELVTNQPTFSSILAYLNLLHTSGNTRSLKQRLDQERISYHHIQNVARTARILMTKRFVQVREDNTPTPKQQLINSGYPRSQNTRVAPGTQNTKVARIQTKKRPPPCFTLVFVFPKLT